MSDQGLGHAFSVWLVNFIADNPNAVGWAIMVLLAFGLVSFLASMVCNGIKYRYPVFAEMPPRARWWLGIMMPLALNWWAVSRRFGVQQPAGGQAQ